MKKIVITNYNNSIISGIYEDNHFTEFTFSKQCGYQLGDIYIGRVSNIVKNINAAFIDIGKDVKCFYQLNDNEKYIFLNHKNSDKMNIGDILLVQISKEGIKTKLPSVSCTINIPGKYVVLVNDSNEVHISSRINKDLDSSIIDGLNELTKSSDNKIGFIVRTDAAEADCKSVLSEAKMLYEQYTQIFKYAFSRPAFTLMKKAESNYIGMINDCKISDIDEIITDVSDIYSILKDMYDISNPELSSKLRLYDDKLLSLSKLYSIDAGLKAATSKKVWLKSGGYLIIEPTEALTVIDVNTGKFSAPKKNKDMTFLKINMEAAYEIGYQLHLRNLSGIIIIDFINMNDVQLKEQWLTAFKEIIAKDNVRCTFVDITKLDLVEITRRKIRRPLHEIIADINNKEDKND